MLVTLVSCVSCPPPPPEFQWRDTNGVSCAPTCGDESCADNLACSHEPTSTCEGATSSGAPLTPCWGVMTAPRGSRDRRFLGDDIAALCEFCCADDGASGDIDDEWCAPLICDPAGQAPPAPFRCVATNDDPIIPGYVRWPEEQE